MLRLAQKFARMRRFGLPASQLLIASAVLSTLPACAVDPDKLTVSPGDEQVLVAEGALGIHAWPNGGISVLPDPSKLRIIVAADVSTYLVEGDDVMHLTSAQQVLAPGEPHGFDNGAAGIGAIYTAPDGTLYGFYHAEDRDGLPVFPSGVPGFYATVALATSSDGGATWTKVGPVITSSQTKGKLVSSKDSDGGSGEPSTALSPDGRYLYLYYTEHARESSLGVQICVARADLQAGPPLPGQFTKYSAGSFGETGIGGHCSAVINGLGFDYADTIGAHVTYSAFAGQYFAVYGVVDWYSLQNGEGLGYSGLSYSTSRDGLAWSSPARLIAEPSLPTKGAPLAWQGTLVWDDAQGQSGWLLYGSSPSWGDPAEALLPHTLAGRRVTLNRD